MMPTSGMEDALDRLSRQLAMLDIAGVDPSRDIRIIDRIIEEIIVHDFMEAYRKTWDRSLTITKLMDMRKMAERVRKAIEGDGIQE